MSIQVTRQSSARKMLRVRLLCTDSSDPADTKVEESLIEATGSWRLGDVRLALAKLPKKDVKALYVAGYDYDDDTLVATLPTRVLSWTPNEPGFHIIESASIQYLFDRGEAYRLQPVLKSLREVNSACGKGPRAMRASSGSGGVYFLKSTGLPGANILACFKPRDDEPGSRNNPNELSTRNGVRPGEAAEREAAAFVLDWNGFSGVPATLLAEAATDGFPRDEFGKTKVGSFQHFVQNAVDTVGDFSPHLFSTREVHKIGLMDIRFLNMDRNDSNILVRKQGDELHLVPIDHGLCFPDHIEVGWCDWVWWDWPQTLQPFDSETKQWVFSLDIEEDLSVLRRCFNLRPECLRIYRCMVTLLKKGVGAGLNLRDLASVVLRSRDIDEPSAMEKTLQRATELTSLMGSNARSKDGNYRGMLKSSSFDGNLSVAASAEKQVPDDLFFSYVDRLLDDIVAEIIERKVASLEDSLDAGWFSASTRSSPSELTKIASPRLIPVGKLSPQTSESSIGGMSSLPMLSLQQ